MKETGSCWISGKAHTADDMDPREMSELLKNGCRISHPRQNLKLKCGVPPGTCCVMPRKEMEGEIKDTQKKKNKREENLIQSRCNHSYEKTAGKGVIYWSTTPSTIRNMASVQTIPKARMRTCATKQIFSKRVERSIFMLFPLYLVILLHIYIKATNCNFLELAV